MKEEPTEETKPYTISKEIVYAAYQDVRRKKGAAGVDGKTITKKSKFK